MADNTPIIVVTQTTNFISLLGNLFVIIHFLKYKSVQLLAITLLFWVSFSNLFVTIGTILSINKILTPGILCNLQAVFIQFGDISGLLWITLISYVLYKITYQIEFDSHSFNFKYIHCVIWSISIILTIFPLFFSNMYGPSGGICWVDDTSTAHIAMRLFIYYFWWALFSLFTVYAAIKVTKYVVLDIELLKSTFDSDVKNNTKIILKAIWYYPIIIIGFTVMYIVWRVLEISTNKVPPALIGLAIGLGNLFGFVNFLVYITNKTVSQNIKTNCKCYQENDTLPVASDEEVGSMVNTDLN